MPTIIVQGKQVPVSDGFFRLSPEEQNTAVKEIAGQMARENVNGTSQPEHSWSELPGNIVPSAVNTATGLWDMVTHPQRTAETLVDAAQGGVDRIMPEEITDFMDTYVSPRSPETRERQRQISGAVGQALKDRYWGLENIKNTMITDPVGIALDIGGIAAGGLGLARAPLTLGSKARLAGAPAEILSAARPAVKKLGRTLSDDNIVTPAINKADGSLEEVVSAYGKRNKIYAPPTKPQRPFEADYTKGVKADEVDAAGNLLVDRHGKPFNPGDIVFGRRTLGGGDVGASHKDFRKLIKRFMSKPIERVPRQHIDHSLGAVRYNTKTNKPDGVYIADHLDLSKTRNKHIIDHEGSHLLDILTGRADMPPDVWNEVESVYSTLATGKENLPKLTLPSNRDYPYSGHRIRNEMAAEVIRAALKEPNYMKTKAPKAYAWAAEQLAKLGIRLNSLGAATGAGAALWAMGQSDESEAAEAPREEDSQANSLRGAGLPAGPSVPFGPIDETKERADSLTVLRKALYRRGLSAQMPKNESRRGLVRALVDLEARQKSGFYGGPR